MARLGQPPSGGAWHSTGRSGGNSPRFAGYRIATHCLVGLREASPSVAIHGPLRRRLSHGRARLAFVRRTWVRQRTGRFGGNLSSARGRAWPGLAGQGCAARRRAELTTGRFGANSFSRREATRCYVRYRGAWRTTGRCGGDSSLCVARRVTAARGFPSHRFARGASAPTFHATRRQATQRCVPHRGVAPSTGRSGGIFSPQGVPPRRVAGLRRARSGLAWSGLALHGPLRRQPFARSSLRGASRALAGLAPVGHGMVGPGIPRAAPAASFLARRRYASRRSAAHRGAGQRPVLRSTGRFGANFHSDGLPKRTAWWGHAPHGLPRHRQAHHGPLRRQLSLSLGQAFRGQAQRCQPASAAPRAASAASFLPSRRKSGRPCAT